MNNHTSAILSISQSTDGTTVVTSAGDNIVNVWDAVEKKLLFTIPIFEVF